MTFGMSIEDSYGITGFFAFRTYTIEVQRRGALPRHRAMSLAKFSLIFPRPPTFVFCFCVGLFRYSTTMAAVAASSRSRSRHSQRRLQLNLEQTLRFNVWGLVSSFGCVGESGTTTTTTSNTCSDNDDSPDAVVVVIAVEDVLWHKSRNSTERVRRRLRDALHRCGYCFLSVHHPKAATVVRQLRQSLNGDFFPLVPNQNDNNDTNIYINVNQQHLQTSTTTYVSEKGLPMYKLGYELCADRVRQVFRIAGANPVESVVYPPTSCVGLSPTPTTIPGTDATPSTSPATPTTSAQTHWVRGMGLLRHVTDTALDLLLMPPHPQTEETQIQRSNNNNTKTADTGLLEHRHARPLSGSSTWWRDDAEWDTANTPDRMGDFSVLYAMHYFNTAAADGTAVVEVEPGIAVKAHFDPSLLVVEPFLCPTTRGLQVWDRQNQGWLDCDGPDSPLLRRVQLVIDEQKRQRQKRQDDANANAEHDNDTGEVMLLFAGKALCETMNQLEASWSLSSSMSYTSCPTDENSSSQDDTDDAMPMPSSASSRWEPTLHRVVTGDAPRRTVIYEQKYAEFFPPPTFD